VVVVYLNGYLYDKIMERILQADLQQKINYWALIINLLIILLINF
jgi:hypothetical protein